MQRIEQNNLPETLEQASTPELISELIKRVSQETGHEAAVLKQALDLYTSSKNQAQITPEPSLPTDTNFQSQSESIVPPEKKELTVDDRAEITAQLIKNHGIALINGKFPPAGIQLSDGTQLLEPYPPIRNRIIWQSVGNIGNIADRMILWGLEPYFNPQYDFQTLPGNVEVFTTMRINADEWQQYVLQKENQNHEYYGRSERARELFEQEVRFIYYFFKSEQDYDGRGSTDKYFAFVVPNSLYHKMFGEQNARKQADSDMSHQFLRKVLERTFPGFQQQVPIKEATSLVFVQNPRQYPPSNSREGDMYDWSRYISASGKWDYIK